MSAASAASKPPGVDAGAEAAGGLPANSGADGRRVLDAAEVRAGGRKARDGMHASGIRILIGRELRGASRSVSQYLFRTLSALVLLVGLVIALVDMRDPAGRGAELFSVLHATLFTLIWVCVPLATCDCISRERREGTLGLLFLTPLRPIEVTAAKAFSNTFQSFSLILAALPVLMVPILLGGVSGMDLVRAALMNLMALLGAAAAGMAASALCRRQNRAMLLAFAFASLTLLLLGDILSVYLLDGVTSSGSYTLEASELGLFLTAGAWVFPANAFGVWGDPLYSTKPDILAMSAGLVIIAGLLLVAVLRLASRRLHALEDSAFTGYRGRWWQILCTPRVFKGWFKARLRGQLEANPVGWLHARTWSARTIKTGLLLAIVIYETVVFWLAGIDAMLLDAQIPLALAIVSLIALAAALSFRNDRETRVLELLLVSPVSPRQMIWGRLRAVYWQFLPALLFLVPWSWFCTAAIHLGRGMAPNEAVFPFTVMLIATCSTLPVIGLSQSLTRPHTLMAWLLTLALGVILPFAGVGTLGILAVGLPTYLGLWRLPLGVDDAFAAWLLLSLLVQAWVTLWSLRRACAHLEARTFAQPSG